MPVNKEEVLAKKKSGSKPNREKADTKKLQAQVTRQRGRVEGRGGKVDKPDKPTLIDKIFGTLSVGGAATSGFVAGGLKNQRKNKGQARQASDLIAGLGGVVSNVAAATHGRDYETYADVLEDSGVKNKYVRGVGGFVGDVALDPTTYLSLGLTKAPMAAKVASKGGKAYAAALASKKAEKIGKTAADVAKTTVLKDLLLGGSAADPLDALAKGAKGAKSAKEAADEAMKAYARKQAKKATKSATTDAAKGSIGLKIMGKEVAKSETLYKGGAKLGEALEKVPGVGTLRDTFQTTRMFPGEVNQLRRKSESFGVAVHEDAAKEYDKLFADLTKADRVRLQYALDEGASLKNEFGTKGADLGKAQKNLRRIYKEFGNESEHVLGMIPKGGQLDDFTYHYYKNWKNPNADKFKKARKAGEHKTLREAKEAGLDPVEDAVEALKLYDAKFNRTVASKKFEDGLIGEFGVKLPDGHTPAKKLGLVKPKGLSSKENVWFPEEIAKSIDYYKKLEHNPYAANKMLRFFDKALSEVKFLQTVANPGHHVRNMAGDMVLNYEDGVVNPLRYKQAASVLFNRDNLKGTVRIGDRHLTYRQIWDDYKRAGGKSGFYPTELSGDTGKVGGAIGAVKGKVRDFSEKREDVTRLAHFIDAYKKEGAHAKDIPELIKASEKAGARVRKFNIDYADLTPFEQNTMRRIVPYYTWLRKNVPLQLEMAAMRPGRLAVVPKGQRAIETLLGTDKNETGQIIPKWIREMAGVSLRGEGEGKNAVYWTPPNPMTDPIGLFSGTKQENVAQLLSQTNPFLRMPFEYATGKTLFSGAPIKDNSKFAGDVIPQIRTARKLKEDIQGKSGKDPAITFLNWLIGASMQEVGETQKQSELRRQQDSLQNFIRKSNEKRKRGK